MILIVVIGASMLVPALTVPVIDNNQPPSQIVTYDTANMPNSYNFHYDASDGSSRTEQGSIKDAGTPQAALDVLGTVRWYDNKGQLYEMSYKAGKRGYRTVIRKIYFEKNPTTD